MKDNVLLRFCGLLMPLLNGISTLECAHHFRRPWYDERVQILATIRQLVIQIPLWFTRSYARAHTKINTKCFSFCQHRCRRIHTSQFLQLDVRGMQFMFSFNFHSIWFSVSFSISVSFSGSILFYYLHRQQVHRVQVVKETFSIASLFILSFDFRLGHIGFFGFRYMTRAANASSPLKLIQAQRNRILIECCL